MRSSQKATLPHTLHVTPAPCRQAMGLPLSTPSPCPLSPARQGLAPGTTALPARLTAPLFTYGQQTRCAMGGKESPTPPPAMNSPLLTGPPNRVCRWAGKLPATSTGLGAQRCEWDSQRTFLFHVLRCFWKTPRHQEQATDVLLSVWSR